MPFTLVPYVALPHFLNRGSKTEYLSYTTFTTSASPMIPFPHLYMYTHSLGEPPIPKHLQRWFLVFLFSCVLITWNYLLPSFKPVAILPIHESLAEMLLQEAPVSLLSNLFCYSPHCLILFQPHWPACSSLNIISIFSPLDLLLLLFLLLRMSFLK